jgi:hypothetical protein
MPIKKETPTRLVKVGETYAVIPSSTISLVNCAVGLGILTYLLDKPPNWTPRKKEICDSLCIGSDLWKRGISALTRADLYMVADIRESGRIIDRVVTVSAVPMGLSPKCGLPNLGETQIEKTPPINITDSKHNISLSKRFRPPCVEDVIIYCTEKGFTFDPDNFIDYWSSVGWKRGRTPMKDWKATARSWARNETNGKPRQTKQSKIKTISISANEGYDIVG